ncbi:MAG: type 4a pilus biogenesis protein PilO [Pseudomonadales bacterium]|nr:type 4a pilus biogenesis protein PilO [Pseudomonadales bacterium]
MNLSELTEGLRDFDINDLDFNNAGNWPLLVKLFVWVLVLGVVIFLGYYLRLNDMNSTLDQAKAKQEMLKKDYENKAFKAANLDTYRQQMADMDKSFGALVKQLPKDTEVPGLLEDITHTGLGSGLEITSIELQPERMAEFYVELPIEIEVKGGFHDFGSFVSGVASLPRIVTLHDFAIQPGESGLLNMTITAKTYRYNDKESE